MVEVSKAIKPAIDLLDNETLLLEVLMEETLEILEKDEGDCERTVPAGVEIAEEEVELELA
jgi:hypothetical protein